MNRPGNHEITTADLDLGELPYGLPLEGWSGMTLHCQVDAIGPSDLHPDLVRLEVSFPPAKRPAASPPPCQRCRGHGSVPDYKEPLARGQLEDDAS